MAHTPKKTSAVLKDTKPLGKGKPGVKNPRKNGWKNKRSGKYNAKGRHIDGHWFASTAEGDRYEQLKDMEQLDQITELELQPAFKVTINNKLVFTYRADFAYTIIDSFGSPIDTIIEDVKGFLTPEYKLKKKIVEAQFSITIAEIPAGNNQIPKKWEGCLPKKKANEKEHKPVPYNEY